MSFGRRLRKKLKRSKFLRGAAAGVTLGGTEIYLHKKKIKRAFKKNAPYIGAAAGAAFGNPALGYSIGGLFGERPDSGADVLVPEEQEAPTMEPQMAQKPAIDPKLLLVGGAILLLVLLK